MSKKTIAILTIVISLVIDQASKIWVKLTMRSGDEFMYIGNWARIHFVENEGMAFGMSFGAGFGKLMLTVFRIIAVFFITYYLSQQIKDKKSSKGFVFALSLILVGAVGNIIDSIFYGQIFSHSEGQIATLFPAEGGYAKWFHGRVVDMFYFPIYRGILPEWIPFFGGKFFEFFQFIFNVADACITVGVAIILLFQKQFFKEEATQDIQATSSNP
ncbi:MAG TPA: lipoprotein signal peptidase [Chitinophagales bacterium]|nr:lipoprotein signal peptidase [Chitinophagales bacterium]HMW11750.1 lipoprotein signal peptidase [Chitinophagales bacterium]HMX60536.1 lipoprotein signal peptidase [Chitinophagales bacterium]HMY23618.1 lipoprotein signal peptidase [Chitinophagales bacterium]HMZ32734.1 lipoprotein signal peptidase [Chitinophagales bacterium]